MNVGNVNTSVAAPDISSAQKGVPMSSVKTSGRLQGKAQRKIESFEKIEAVKEELNEQMAQLNTNIGFSISRENNKFVVEIKNKETEELIKQVPTDELLQIQEKMAELTGLLFDKSA